MMDVFEAIEQLKTALQEGRLSLVLGSGISYANGVPSWGGMLDTSAKRLLKEASDQDKKKQILEVLNQLKSPSPPELPAIAASLEEAVGRPDLVESIRVALYGGSTIRNSYQSLNENETLIAIALLVVVGGRRCVREIMTYNYDDLVERYVSWLGGSVACAATYPAPSGIEDVTVFHPHGLLQMKSDSVPYRLIGAEGNLVVTTEDYDKASEDANAWSRKKRQLSDTTTVLVVGLSGHERVTRLHFRESKRDTRGHVGYLLTHNPSGIAEREVNAAGLAVVDIGSPTRYADFLLSIRQASVGIPIGETAWFAD